MNPGEPHKPPPPPPTSNYRRPGWEPPLFLEEDSDGKRELVLAFALAFAAPVAALFVIYGLFMGVGGIYCAIVSLQRGRKVAILALILNILAIPTALLGRFLI